MSDPYYMRKFRDNVPLPFDEEITDEPYSPPENIKFRTCQKCSVHKPLLEFYRDRDDFDWVCKICSKHESKVRTRVRRNAPPKPSVCDCCGEVPASIWCMDHDHKTEKFRGWVCQRCNIGLGKFGDCIEGLMKAVSYLKRTNKSNTGNIDT